MPSRRDELQSIAEQFLNTSIALATGSSSYEDWEHARAIVLSQPELIRVMPEWVAKCRFGGQFWPFIKGVSPSYQGRREYLYASLAPLFDILEDGETMPISEGVRRILRTCDSNSVAGAWTRIQSRRDTDSEGAITAARALLESTCKYILDAMGGTYTTSEELPTLYGKAAALLNLAPQNHNEQVFKQILSGCFSVVNGLAAMRNALGDAHGKTDKSPRPEPRHADLAINLAGSLSTFLIETYENRFRTDTPQ